MDILFFLEGAIEIVLFFQLCGLPRSWWALSDGLITLLLAWLIWRSWPVSSHWAIGTILGVNLIVSGTTRLMYSIAARKVLSEINL